MHRGVARERAGIRRCYRSTPDIWRSTGAERDRTPGRYAITADYRDVLSEILSQRLGSTQPDQVFPGCTPTFPGAVV